jgi:hypothetical protein
LSRNKNIVGLNPRPDGIERFEPVEEVGILRGRDGAREGLVKVMMRVDQPRQEDMTFEVKHFIGSLRKFARRADLFDEAVTNKKTTLGKLPLMVVHGDKIGVFDEKSCH